MKVDAAGVHIALKEEMRDQSRIWGLSFVADFETCLETIVQLTLPQSLFGFKEESALI